MICVAANPSADATFSVDRLEPGAIHRPHRLRRVAGGKAMNVARAAVRLGGEAAVVVLAPEHGRGLARARSSSARGSPSRRSRSRAVLRTLPLGVRPPTTAR